MAALGTTLVVLFDSHFTPHGSYFDMNLTLFKTETKKNRVENSPENWKMEYQAT